MMNYETGMADAEHPKTIETASLERGGSRRRVLFDESVARHAYGSDERPRAGVMRSPLEWAAAAVHFLTGTHRVPPASTTTDDVEIRNASN
jgi:hypothetical protein